MWRRRVGVLQLAVGLLCLAALRYTTEQNLGAFFCMPIRTGKSPEPFLFWPFKVLPKKKKKIPTMILASSVL